MDKGSELAVGIDSNEVRAELAVGIGKHASMQFVYGACAGKARSIKSISEIVTAAQKDSGEDPTGIATLGPNGLHPHNLERHFHNFACSTLGIGSHLGNRCVN